MTTPRAIPTKYAGHLFRSRLEARWAVFFDALKISWQYEAQGYLVGDPPRAYLPDFLLPKSETWVEVKGDVDLLDWKLLSDASHVAGLLLVLGPVPDVTQNAWTPMHPVLRPISPGTCMCTQAAAASFIGAANSFDIWIEPLSNWYGFAKTARPLFNGARCLTDEVGGGRNRGLPLNSDVRAAYRAARSARFEHGESGGVL